MNGCPLSLYSHPCRRKPFLWQALQTLKGPSIPQTLIDLRDFQPRHIHFTYLLTGFVVHCNRRSSLVSSQKRKRDSQEILGAHSNGMRPTVKGGGADKFSLGSYCDFLGERIGFLKDRCRNQRVGVVSTSHKLRPPREDFIWGRSCQYTYPVCPLSHSSRSNERLYDCSVQCGQLAARDIHPTLAKD